jgi:hypothetical protein
MHMHSVFTSMKISSTDICVAAHTGGAGLERTKRCEAPRDGKALKDHRERPAISDRIGSIGDGSCARH